MEQQAKKGCPECGSLEHDGCLLAELGEPTETIEAGVNDRVNSGEIKVEWVDSGVGPHEYWGAAGNHAAWTPEISRAYKVGIQWLYGPDAAGEDIVVPTAHSFVLQLEDVDGRIEGELGIDATLEVCSVQKTEGGLLCCASYWIEQGD